MEVALWAESPQLHNPTAMDVDERGRLWVTEAVNYRKWGGRNPGLTHEEGDRLLILEDTDGDGQCDRSTVFAQGPELVSPLGVCVLGKGRVLVSCSPDAFLYIDDDGDDRADRRETFLTGFGGPNHDHGLHSFVPGPDGQLYFAAGNAGPHLVTDRAGWRLRSGSIYVGGGEFTADNKPGLVSDDGRAWTGGLALRVGVDGAGLQVLAHNFRNNYEVALDSFGNMFLSDNDDDGNRSCRTLWAMEGGNYGYFSEDGTRYWRADRRPGQEIQRAHWHQDDPGVSPPGTINGAGGPTGVCVYEGDLLGEWIDGAVLNADAGAGVVYAHRPQVDGAGYRLDPGWLIRGSGASNDESARWFRPSDVCVGLDGSVFVADWYDPGVGGHAAGDRAAYGRILRITPKGVSSKQVPIAFDGPEDALRALESPAPSVRAMGATRLFDSEEGELSTILRALAGSQDPRIQSRLLFGLARQGRGGLEMVKSFLKHADDDRLRVAALRALRSVGALDGQLIEIMCQDPSASVRREILVAIGPDGGLLADDVGRWGKVMFRLAKGYDGADRHYLEAFGQAFRGRESLTLEMLLAFGDSAELDDSFWDIAWRLHPEGFEQQFAERAADSALSLASRKQATDALAFIPSRAAAEAMMNLALLDKGEIGHLASWWVRHRDSNDWREYGLGQEMATGDFASAELLWKSDVMRSGTVTAHIDLQGAERIWLEVDDGGDGNSCDWADWIDPCFIVKGSEVSLTELAWVKAEAAWGNVNKNANAGGGKMRAGGRAIERGIGAHAKSVIEYVVPPGTTSFVCSVGPDEGGTRQNEGNTTSLQFRIHAQVSRDRSAILAAEAILFDEKAPMASREAAALTLAEDPEGGLILIRRARSGELPEELHVAVQMAIFTNPDIAVRALASEVFARPGEENAALPPIAELVALEGDASRGRHLYQSEKALCATCHTFDGLGRDIGPDLTAIGEKYDRTALIDSILNPSAGIAFGYESTLLNVDGEGYMAGFILAEGRDVVLKDSGGMRHVIASEDILDRVPQSTSIMPQGVALGLGAQGIADLASFLLEDRETEPVYGEPVVLFDGTSLDAWSYHLNAPNARMEDVWSIEEDGVLRCKGNPIGYIYTNEVYENFRLELEWRFDPAKGAGNSGVLLRKTGKDKVWPKSIEAQLQSRSAGDIWNIDKVAMIVDESRTNGRRTVKQAPCNEKPLGEWNHYSITLDRGDLTLVVNGDVQNTARWCDELAGNICLQSEGAEIHFRNIVLHPIVGHE